MNERDAQVGTNGGLSQRWRAAAARNGQMLVPSVPLRNQLGGVSIDTEVKTLKSCAEDVDAAKLRIEEAVRALPELHRYGAGSGWVSRDAVLKIIREIL